MGKKIVLLISLILSLGLMLTACGAGGGGGGGNNTPSEPATTEYNAHFVAVGDAGIILHSEDGETWNSAASGTGADIVGIGYGNGRLVAVGDGGIVLYSDNGEDWSVAATDICDCTLNGVAFGNGVWIAVGDGGYIVRSTDGANNWTGGVTSITNRKLRKLRGIAYANGLWIAVGIDGTIIKSADDGNTWTDVSLTETENNLNAVAYGDQWVAVGDGIAIKSADGSNWSSFDPENEPSIDDRLTDATYGNGLWVGVGVNVKTGATGIIVNSNEGYYSLDGVAFAGVTYGNGTWIAVGSSGTIVKSGDGTNWSPVTSGTDRNLAAVTFRPTSF